MKLLKIEDNCGHFLLANGEFGSLDKLTKDDLLRLVDLTLSEEVVFDNYEDTPLGNHAHQIIYKSVYEKLTELASRRKEFSDESERLYLEDYDRYRADTGDDGTGKSADRCDSRNK